MIITIGETTCPGSAQYCHQWDYDIENYAMTKKGDTLELGRLITPYANTGVPGFLSTWQQHYIYDITDFYTVLQDSATIQNYYSGYSYGFTGDVKFAFIEGTPERNVLGYDKLWNSTYSYGNLSDNIDNHLTPYSLTPPANTASAEMKFLITGHGSDSASGCCEFDNSGVGHTYQVLANNNVVAAYNMNINCGWSELYPQGGTWLAARAGNWCPGGSVNMAQYPLTGVTAGTPYTTDVSFDSTYNGLKYYGIYKIASEVFYYGTYNKTLDASLEDIIAPTNFEWYRRENPRASVPVIKVRNTGGTTITSMLLAYGLKDSTMAQYIWTGALAPLTDTIISLPALNDLTSLSEDSALGTYNFRAVIQQVNGQSDNDQSNDTLGSQFTLAPKWPYKFLIKMTTSSMGADGNFGSNPSDASWQITDANNNVVASRTNTNVTTTYNDTVTLAQSGFYTLSVSTTQCAGLQWWYFTDYYSGSGYTAGSLAVENLFRNNLVLNLNGTANTGAYKDDFGCGFNQYFTVKGPCTASTPVITQSGDTLTTAFAFAYQWYKNGNAISGATNQTYAMGAVDGNYTVEITNNNNCTAMSASYPFLNNGVKDLSALAASVSIFPNPAKDAFNINVSAELTGTTYSMYDMTGRELLKGKIEGLSNTIPVSSISSGIYLVAIGNGVSNITKTVIIQK